MLDCTGLLKVHMRIHVKAVRVARGPRQEAQVHRPVIVSQDSTVPLDIARLVTSVLSSQSMDRQIASRVPQTLSLGLAAHLLEIACATPDFSATTGNPVGAATQESSAMD